MILFTINDILTNIQKNDSTYNAENRKWNKKKEK